MPLKKKKNVKDNLRTYCAFTSRPISNFIRKEANSRLSL